MTILTRFTGYLILTAFATGCTPTVQDATKDPIEINLKVQNQHEIRVQVDREL